MEIKVGKEQIGSPVIIKQVDLAVDEHFFVRITAKITIEQVKQRSKRNAIVNQQRI